MIDLGSAVGYLELDTQGMERGFTRARSVMQTFQNETSTTADKFSAMGSALTSVGAGMTLGITAPLLGIGAAAVKTGMDFDAQMSKVQAISGATSDEFGKLRDMAIDLGSKTAFSASEAALGMENLASAGFTTTEIMEAMPGLLDLAAASGADLATASEIASSAVRGFGLEASETAHVADVLAEASARTNAQVEDMGEAMKYIAPVANAMGMSIEETAAAIGIMSDAGIKGSQAGTSLRGALSRLAKPTSEATAVMKEYGMSFYDANGNMLSMQGIIGQLETGLAGLSQEQRNQALITLFGQESLSGMLALMEAGSGTLGELTGSFEDCAGAAKSMAEIMMDNLSGKWTEMKSAIETLAIRISDVLTPVIEKAVEGLTAFFHALSGMSDAQLGFVVAIAGAVAALGPLLLIIGSVATAIGTLMPLIAGAGGIGAALTALATGPIGIVIAAVTALAVAFATNFGGIRDMVFNVMNSISSIISSVWAFIVSIWESNMFNIQGIVTSAWTVIQTVFSTAFSVISALFQVFAAAFSGDWSTLWESIKNLVNTIWEGIKSLVNAALNYILNLILGIAGGLYNAATTAFNKVKEGFQNVWNTIKSWFELAKQDPITALSTLGSALYSAASSAFNNILSGFQSVWGRIKSWVEDKVNWIKNKWAEITSAASGIGDTTVSGGKRKGGSGGSFASGLDYVPRDMNVRVHEGEAILTAQENRNRSKFSSGGDTYNFYSPEALTPVKAAREFKRVKQELALGYT